MKLLQSWDDGIIDDERLTALLRKYNAKATFNLNIGLNKEERSYGWTHENKKVWRLGLKEMPEVYKGFEIASHSMTHPYLTQCSDEQLYYQIFESRKILQDMFNQPVKGFCYPFGDFNDRIKDLLREAGYTHARGICKTNGFFPVTDFFEFDPHCHFAALDFMDIYRNAEENGADYFFFWGHSYEFMNEKMWENFEDKLQILTNNPQNVWCNISDLFR